MGINVLISQLEKHFPLSLQEEWDNSGWQVKLPFRNNRVLVSLSLSEEVVREAVDLEATLIITHHPLIFRPFRKVVSGDYESSLLISLIQKGISLYTCHTPCDICPGGIADFWAELFALRNVRPIVSSDPLVKLSVLVPVKDYESFRHNFLIDMGNALYENYRDCTFHSVGEGRFTPLEGSNPAIGSNGTEERVEEIRMETLLRESEIQNASDSIRRNHPYEVPAFDFSPLSSANITPAIGLGRKGTLPEKKSLERILEILRENGVSPKRIGGKDNREFKKLYIMPGACGKALRFVEKGALMITSDLSHHDLEFAYRKGFTVVDTSHVEIELPFLSIVDRIVGQNEVTAFKSKKESDYTIT